jgi:hypothetical protein
MITNYAVTTPYQLILSTGEHSMDLFTVKLTFVRDPMTSDPLPYTLIPPTTVVATTVIFKL